jgi:hypothetical protein
MLPIELLLTPGICLSGYLPMIPNLCGYLIVPVAGRKFLVDRKVRRELSREII